MKTFSLRSSNALGIISTWILIVTVILCQFQITRSNPITDDKKLPEGQNHSVSDLLRFMDDLVVDSSPKDLESTFKRFQSSQKLVPRSYGRQIPGPQGFYGDGPYQRPGRPIAGPLGDGFYRPDGPPDYGLYDPPGTVASGLVEALTSISQYDDLKCVPRLLCEIATGSKPGDGDYKASTLGDFGKNTLIGLLTAYNFEAASPVLGFGKAALLGYSSRGDSSICYDEYVRCPRDPRDLVYYLNNHNGGFFRFFKQSRRGAAVAQGSGSNRMGFSLKEPAPPPGLSGPESDRTGTGQLRFDIPEPSARQDDEKNLLRFDGDVISRVVFPEDEKIEDDSRPSSSRVQKSLKPSVSDGFFPASSFSQTHSTFFPSEDEDLIRTNLVSENVKDSRLQDSHSGFRTNVVFETVEDSRHQGSHSNFRGGRWLLPDYEDDHRIVYSSIIKFPDEVEGFQNFGTSGTSSIFPDE